MPRRECPLPTARSGSSWIQKLAVLLVGCLAQVCLAQQRPASIDLLPGVVKLESITYDSATPADLSKPAAGTGKLTVAVYGLPAASKDGVKFTNLLTDGQGKFKGIAVTLDAPLTVTITQAPPCTLEIPSGQVSFTAPGAVAASGGATLTLPLRTSDGTPIKCTVGAIKSTAGVSGGELTLETVTLTGKAAAEGLKLAGLQIRPSSLTYSAKWGAAGPLAWTLLFPKVDIGLSLPGLPVDTEIPLEAKADVTTLTVNQDGEVSFAEAKLTTGKLLRPISLPGLELAIKGGSISMKDSVPAFKSIVVDLTLPSCLTDASGKPVVVSGLGIDLSGDGPVLEIQKKLSLKCGPFAIELRKFTLDLSAMSKGGGSPPAAVAKPAWTGIWIQEGDFTLPVGEPQLKVSLANFVIDAGGLTGQVKTSLPNCAVESFDLTGVNVDLQLLRSQLVAGGLTGKIDIPGMGLLDGKFEFSASGKSAFTLNAKVKNELLIKELGLTLSGLKARLGEGKLVLSGTMEFTPPAGMEMPPGLELKGLSLAITDFKVDSKGKLYLPAGGQLKMPQPAVVDLKLFEAEIRSVAFTSRANKLNSVTFSGAARLKTELESFPIGGELDFEGFTVTAPTGSGRPPTVEVGGIGVAAEIPEFGEIKASLGVAHDSERFAKGALYGGAELKLTCMGDAGGTIGGGLSLLISPEQGAWFIGGRAEFPPILVQIPPAPPAVPAPVPLFNICGFAGGFGVNVVPVEPGTGPIISPIKELKFSSGALLFQAGLLLADPVPGVPGKLWWGDVTLTGTIDPVTVDLTGRLALLDAEGTPRWLDTDDFNDLDRHVKAYMNMDFDKGVFLVGGKADLCFPKRDDSLNLIQFEGEGVLRVDGKGMALDIGWEDAGQKPVKITFAKAVRDKIKLTGKVGLEAVVSGSEIGGGMMLDLDADLSLPGVDVGLDLWGTLAVSHFGTESFKATGDLGFEGTAEFGDLFKAEVDGRLATTLTNRKLKLAGKIHGKAGPFEQSATVATTVEVE